jgi:hypothetical protein
MKTKQGNPSPNSHHEAIARRAYEIYASRGYVDGFAEEDWLEAEAQLRDELTHRQGSSTPPRKARARPAKRSATSPGGGRRSPPARKARI